MRAKNDELLLAIKKVKEKGKPEREQALDAILKANPQDPVACRKAIVDNKTFWEGFPGSIMVAPTVPQQTLTASIFNALSNAFSNPQRVLEYHKSDQFLDPSNDGFKKIHQAATEERVKLGLDELSPETLVGIFQQQNDKQLRDYLADKLYTQLSANGVSLSSLPGWNSNNEDILTNDALLEIKHEAANLLLLKLVEKPEVTKPQLYADLMDAYTNNNANKLKATAKAIATAVPFNLAANGMNPDSFADALTLNVPDLRIQTQIIAKATARKYSLDKEEAALNFHPKRKKFEDEVSNATLLGMAHTLKQANPRDFLVHILPFLEEDLPLSPYKNAIGHLEDGDKDALGKDVQQRLVERFLKAKLENLGATAFDDQLVANILNATDKASLIRELNLLYTTADPDQLIIAKAVTDTNINDFKVAITKGIINKLGADGKRNVLNELDAASAKLDTFRTTIADKVKKGVTFDFLKKEHLSEFINPIHQYQGELAANTRAGDFQTKIDEVSRFGKELHPQLIEVFKKLPVKKQTEILENPQQISVLVNAETEEELKYHLGSKDKSDVPLVLTNLVEENKKVHLCKQIYNPTVAKVLMVLDLPLTQDKIDSINTKLIEERGNTNANAGDYKRLIDKIYTACGANLTLTQKTALYTAFNQNENNNNLLTIAGTESSYKVLDDIVINKPLLDAHEGGALGPTQKKFVEILARVTGVTSLTVTIKNPNGNGTDVTLPMNTDANIRDIYNDTFHKSSNVYKFLDKLIPDTVATDGSQAKALKENLKKEFTPEVFSQLKGASVESLIALDKLKDVENIINRDLKRIQDSTPTIEKYKEQLKHLAKDIDSLPLLYSAANEVKAKNKAEKMITEYQELAKQCDTLVEHLESAKRDLQVRIDAIKIPPEDNTDATQNKIEKLKELRGKLQSESDKVSNQLDFFLEVNKKIRGEKGVVANIEAIMKRKATVVEDHISTEYSIIDRGKGRTAEFKQKEGAAQLEALNGELNQDRDNPSFKVHEIPEKGRLLCADTTYVKPDPTNTTTGTKEFKSRITVDYHPSAPITSIGKNVSNSHPTKVTLDLVPQDKEFLAASAMKMARILLKDWDGKSNIKIGGPKVEYLWTALCLLGEQHPKFSREKIMYKPGTNWRPDDQRNWKGYTENSLYHKVFKGSAKGLVEEQVNKFASDMDENRRAKVDKGLAGATHTYKTELSKDKPKDIETVAEKDMKVQGAMAARRPGMGGGDE